MRVLLESTTKTTELLPESQGRGVNARVWQGHVDELDRDALVAELRELATQLLEGPSPHEHRERIAERLRNAAKLVEVPGSIEVHALVARVAHKEDERAEVVSRFAKELQAHASPRPAIDRFYSLRMFI